jgi:hypothetical protein
MAKKTTTPAAKKTKAPAAACPVSLEQFRAQAKAIVVQIGDEKKMLMTKEFASGSYGWFTNEKITLMVGDTPVKVQCNLQMIIVGSKPSAGTAGDNDDAAE